MREILFRGIKTETKGEWIEGYFKIIHGKCYIVNYDYSPFEVEVYEHTVSQFTGILDVKGNKIFEGDVLNYDNIEGIVNFKDGSFFVRFEYLRSLHLLGELERDLEIIGNIHE